MARDRLTFKALPHPEAKRRERRRHPLRGGTTREVVRRAGVGSTASPSADDGALGRSLLSDASDTVGDHTRDGGPAKWWRAAIYADPAEQKQRSTGAA